ncbi:MAG: hypothetical protein ABIH39_00670 [Candidatus Margulisiibacteriota bacterium]
MKIQGLDNANIIENAKFKFAGDKREISLNYSMVPKVTIETGSTKRDISFRELQTAYKDMNYTMPSNAIKSFTRSWSPEYQVIRAAIRSDVKNFFDQYAPFNKEVKTQTINKITSTILKEFDAKVMGKDVDMKMTFILKDSDYK